MANKQRLIGLALIILLVLGVMWYYQPPADVKPAPKSPTKSKTILNATMAPVENAPDGTYIIEYSNGNKEILHPDGTRLPLVISPEQAHHEE